MYKSIIPNTQKKGKKTNENYSVRETTEALLKDYPNHLPLH